MELKKNEITKIKKQLEKQGDLTVIEITETNKKGFVEVKFKHPDPKILYLKRKQDETCIGG